MGTPDTSPLPRRQLLRLAGAAAVAPALTAALPPRPASAQTIKFVSRDYGWDAVDATGFLQLALNDEAADIIVIDNLKGTNWITRPLFITRANPLEIRVPRGVTVSAKLGAYPDKGDSLFTMIERSNITFYGPGATFKMNKDTDDDYNVGEHRMGIRMYGCVNILISGLTIRDTGGDGIYLGGPSVDMNDDPNARRWCEDVVVSNVSCLNNRRLGIGVVSADGLLVRGCAFNNSNGVNPEGGVDFEPDGAPNWGVQRLAGITFEDCVFFNNAQDNVRVVLGNMTSTSPPVDILLNRVRIGGQTSQTMDRPNLQIIGADSDSPTGTIEVRDSFIYNTPRAGCLGVFANQAYGAVQVKLTRTTFWSWGTTVGTYRPIAIGPRHTMSADPIPEYGNVTWTRCSMFTSVSNPFLTAHLEPAGSLGMANLQGDLMAVNPNVTPDEYYGAQPHDIGLAVDAGLSAPAQTVTVIASPTVVPAGQSAALQFRRSSADLSRPLAVAYDVSGTAVQRYDYTGLGLVAVIPAGQTFVNLPLKTGRPDGGTGTRTVRVAIQSFPAAYTVGSPGVATVSITG